jgi:hypothetical protein
MLPSLLYAIVCGREVDTATERVKKQVREVEVRTGFHMWADRTEPPAKGDLVELSAKMSGCGTRAVFSKRKLEILEHVICFVVKRTASNIGSGNDKPLSIIGALERRMDM